MFEALASLLYEHFNDILSLGNFNSRMTNKGDFIIENDCIPQRIPIDDVVNEHGRALINFRLQSKMCILNG